MHPIAAIVHLSSLTRHAQHFHSNTSTGQPSSPPPFRYAPSASAHSQLGVGYKHVRTNSTSRTKGVIVNTMQVYASELSKFEFEDKKQTILVAGEGIVGIELVEAADLDVTSLVGAKTSEAVAIDAGSRWSFRDERPLVESGNGGTFAFLVPVL